MLLEQVWFHSWWELNLTWATDIISIFRNCMHCSDLKDWMDHLRLTPLTWRWWDYKSMIATILPLKIKFLCCFYFQFISNNVRTNDAWKDVSSYVEEQQINLERRERTSSFGLNNLLPFTNFATGETKMWFLIIIIVDTGQSEHMVNFNGWLENDGSRTDRRSPAWFCCCAVPCSGR